MDNASKALIMAGAILISVAIVGIGIYIFSAANSMTNDAVNQMESTQVSMFNSNFYRYANEGNDILGTRVNELLQHAKSVGFKAGGGASAGGNTYSIPESPDARKKYKITYSTDSATGYIDGVTATVQ